MINDHESGPVNGQISIQQDVEIPRREVNLSTYFVTFRLAGALPTQKLIELQEKRDEELRILFNRNKEVHPITQEEIDTIHKSFNKNVECYLDSGHGSCVFKNHKVAEFMRDCLLHFHDQRYSIHAWCIMPNHVHCIVQPYQGYPLNSILKSWKSFSTKQINTILGWSGKLWQSEGYEHTLNNNNEYDRATEYILTNPERVHLNNWKWVGKTESKYL